MKKSILLLIVILVKLSSVSAATITVPNGDFSDTNNYGSLTTSLGQTKNPLGSGPWSAQTSALLGFLGAPTATIGGGTAQISTLLGLGVLGQSNSAQFYQTIAGQAYAPFTTYTLSALVVTGTTGLNLSILGNNGIGIALTKGGNLDADVVADSNTANVSLVSLTPLPDTPTDYTLTLQYLTTASAPSGALGIRLYAGENADLVSLSLLGSVTFDTVTLTAVPEPSGVGLAIVGLCGAALAGRKRSLAKWRVASRSSGHRK